MAPARQNANSSSSNNNNNYNENGDHFIPHSNNSSNSSSGRITISTTTGAVPKTTTTAKRLATLIKQQMQHQQQQHQQQQRQQQQQQRKNTEIVQPLQRELKTLNDFLLASVNRTRINSSNSPRHQPQKSHQQQPNTHESISTLGAPAGNYDTVDNLQENQRSFFPVRPIQRVRHQQATRAARFQNQQQQTQQQASDANNAAASTYATNATIGVVIPTTPNTVINSASNSSSNPLPLQQNQQQQLEANNVEVAAGGTATAAGSEVTGIPAIINDILTTPVVDINSLRQQFELVRGILGLDENWNSHIGKQSIFNVQVGLQQPNLANMVHEINPNANERDGVVNSASLEDVALSEMSDNRAQSIQSLHSNPDTPTPDTTPSFDELQERLAASSRNMQNIQDKQEQLLRLQSAAKAHLSEMEQLRQQTNKLSFSPSSNGVGGTTNGDAGDGPNYESIEQVQNDMTSLVGRMKNLTAFIHNQNELSNILGDDGPEIIAEQEALQQKLESLRAQRDDMRHLVDELQSINSSAEHQVAAANSKSRNEASAAEHDRERQLPDTAPAVECAPTSVRNVPIEIQQKASSAAQRAVAAQAMIDQKNADIDALKSQMQRLKDMLTTVNMIEERAGDTQKTCCTPPTTLHERTPLGDLNNDENIARKVRALSKVTADLRAESASLEQERDRINALKEEIIRRKEQAAAAAQMGEDAIKRSSLTPTPTPALRQQQQYYEGERDMNTRSEREQLKSEYEMKKKEFDFICKRLEGENLNNVAAGRTTMSEADDEADDTNDSDFSINKYCGKQQPTSNCTLRRELSSSTVVENTTREASQQPPHKSQQQTQQQRQKHLNDDESNVAMANSTIDGASLDAASQQSGSTRSYFMPPPMPPVGSAWAAPILPPLPATWNSNYFYANTQPPPPPPPVSQRHIHTANEYVSALGGCAGTATNSSINSNLPTAPLNTTDPMIVQQIIQTQQMLINSICQSNQTLWHQQREIDGINGVLHALQDRVSNLSAAPADMGFALRSESVPPPSALSGSTNVLNNQHYLSASRAQSEQPPPFSSGGNAFANYQQHQQHVLQQRQQHQQRSNLGVYNYEVAQQQQHSSSSVYHATLNNAAANGTAPPPVTHPTHFNNETPMSPHMPNSPGPIFMHHHNNTIHQNNANLRTQNQHAVNNNLHQQQQQQTASSNQPTLNNQVPPGNRANNYWDNFRSYSRQNLLSLNSTKSNEDQQQLRLHDLRQHFAPASTSRRHTYTAGAAVHHHVQRQQQQQHQQQQQAHLFDIASARDNLNTVSLDSNNLNCNNSNNNAKYMNIMTPHQSRRRPYQPNVADDFYENLQRRADEIIGNTALFRNCDIDSTNMATNLNNMNLNYGNSPLFQRNKVPAKSATSATLIQPQQPPPSSQIHRNYDAAVDACLFDEQCEDANIEYSAAHRNFPKHVQLQRRSMLRLAHDFEPFELHADTSYSHAREEEFPPRPVNIVRTCENSGAIEGHSGDHQHVTDTSEEINRNLLVNALKNDKFTTKFYESIKEDVFRRLERLFEQHEQIENNRLRQPPANTDFCNVVDPQRDPFRKLNLNQQQQQQQQHIKTSSVQTDAELEAQMLLDDDIRNAETESNKADDGDVEMANSVLQKTFDNNNDIDVDDNDKDNDDHDDDNDVDDDENRDTTQNEKPEDETSIRHEAIIKERQCVTTKLQRSFQWTNSTNAAKCESVKKLEQPDNCKQRHRLSLDATTTSHADDCVQGTASGSGSATCSFSSKKKKSMENEKFFVSVVGCQSPPPEIEIMPDYELIEYIIKRIRNQTHTNTVMNDSMLVEISKLTATAAQNSANAKLATKSSTLPILSAKRIYAKIKKLCISRNRDEFLTWYQEYLEGVFLVEHEFATNYDLGQRIQHTNKIIHEANNKSVKTRFAGVAARQQQKQIQQHQGNNGDLAEADQNSANNSVTEVMEETTELDKNPLGKEDGNDEFENNENPEEEGAAGTAASALATPQEKTEAGN